MRLTQGEKSERSQGLILEAALQLFSKQGYRGTSIREIAEEAGVSTGNVYHHFPDKEALFRTLLDQYWAAIDTPDFPFNKALAAGAFPDDQARRLAGPPPSPPDVARLKQVGSATGGTHASPLTAYHRSLGNHGSGHRYRSRPRGRANATTVRICA